MSFYIGNALPKSIRECLLRLAQNIELERESNKGANGYLFFGRNRVSGVRVAVKFYYWGGDKLLHIEPQTLSEIRSPNVIEIYDAGYADASYAYFVTPYYEIGDADEYLKRNVGNLAALDLTCQILNGLTHLHQQRLLHRDLKPENIYIKDDGVAIIGDFGSIKKIPEGNSAVPGSKHSMLYRPPESIDSNRYGFTGDVYQTGVFLYQALGGFLPYEEIAWLTNSELKHYEGLHSPGDQTMFADQCLRTKITKGRILDNTSLPAWVPENLRRIIRKACHTNPENRFSTASEFRLKLHDARRNVSDWKVVDGAPTCNVGGRSFRIITSPQGSVVEKRVGAGWRRANNFVGANDQELCRAIDASQG